MIHEAAEALGNLNETNSLWLLQKFENRDKGIVWSPMVRETCELARDLITWNKKTDFGKSEQLDLQSLKFTTNDPAPPFNYKVDKKYADI